MNKKKQQMPDLLIRSALIDVNNETDGTPKVRMSISSEEPVLTRAYVNGEWREAFEILDHSEMSVDLSRCKDGLVVLDRHYGDQIGLLDNVRVEDKRLVGDVQFCTGQRAQEIMQDAVKGLRRNVSVGYRVNGSKYVQEGQRDGVPVVRAKSWMPYETSFEPVPADASVGVGRSHQETTPEPEQKSVPETRRTKMDNEMKGLIPEDVVEVYRLARAFNIEPGAADEHIKAGKTVEEFRSIALKKAETDKAEMQRKLDEAATKKPDAPAPAQTTQTREFDEAEKKDIQKRYSIWKVLRSLAGFKEDVGFEREVSEEIGKRSGKPAQGFYIPHDAPILDTRADPFLKAGNGSAFVATDLLVGQFIDALRSRMVLSKAGATVLSGLTGDIAIPKGGTITGGWVDGENGDATEGKPTVSQIPGTPKTAGAWTDISRRMLLQSSINAQSFVTNELLETLARLIEVAAFAGTNANGQPKGLKSWAGVNNPAVTANAPTRAQLIAFLTSIQNANADIGTESWIMTPLVRGMLMNTVDVRAVRNEADDDNVGGGPMQEYLFDHKSNTMLGSPGYHSTNVPAHHLFYGAWSQLVLAMWSGADLIVDPYTNSTSGALRIVALQDADILVRNGESFSFNAAVTA